MAADIPIKERLVILDRPVTETPQAPGAAAPEQAFAGRVVHVYGDRIRIVDEGPRAEVEPEAPQVPETPPADLTPVEALGLEAFRIRSSREFAEAKANRPKQGEDWNLPPGGCVAPAASTELGAEDVQAAAPTSAYMEGTIAVGIVIVDGPTAALKFTAAERAKVVAEVQNGLSYYAATYPAAGLQFVYDVRLPSIATPANPGAADLEAVFRNPALGAMGFSASWAGVSQYIEQLRTNLKTRWTYCVFFTKYPVGHFAYASIGGPRIVMQYSNDGWGPDNIDRVFAHETGHIFMAPDEYAASGCNCAGTWGRFSKPNTNCQNCAPGGGVPCIMKGNDWTMCAVTPAHIGWVAARFIAKVSSRAMDVTGASQASGAPLIQWQYHGGENQCIRPDPLGDGYFRLVAQHSGKVLDVEGGSTANGARIIQFDWHGGDNQRFRLDMLDDGYVRITAKHSGKVIDVAGFSTVNGAQLIQWDYHGGANQRWMATAPLGAKHSGLVLDVSGASTAAGAKIIQWPYHGGPNQVFRVEALGGGDYRFVSQHSGLVLDVTGASTANGAQIIQWNWHGGANQRFRIVPLGDGYCAIVAKHSNKVLDISGASTGGGAQLIQYQWHGGPNQRFLIPRWVAVTAFAIAAASA